MNSKPTIIFDPYPRNEEMVFTREVEEEKLKQQQQANAN